MDIRRPLQLGISLEYENDSNVQGDLIDGQSIEHI